MIDLIIQWAGPILLALGGILGFGAIKKRQGRKEAKHDFEEQDRKAADVVRHNAREARLSNAGDKRSAVERLRASGRIRDE